MALLGWVYGLCKQPGQARQILHQLLEQSRARPFSGARHCAGLYRARRKDRAFEWLDKAVDQRDLDVTLQWDSPYDTLRSDARFSKLLRRMKLV